MKLMGKSTNGFGSSTTAEEVIKGIDLTGKTVFITGANTGIGRETARVMAKAGAQVIMGCRNKEKMELAIKQLKDETKSDKIQGLELDLEDFKSIRTCAENFKKLNLPIHCLILNAGVMACPKGKTKDGFETQIGTNHLGHFLLTMLLLDTVVKSAPARIVALASLGHKWAPKSGINFDDINFDKSYNAWTAYGQSKLANILFASELNRRLQEAGVQVTANSLHPGVIQTELGRHQNRFLMSIYFTLGALFTKSIPQGAATTVYVATAKELEGKGGLYFSDCNISETKHPKAKDMELAKKLWEWSEKAVGEKFSIQK